MGPPMFLIIHACSNLPALALLSSLCLKTLSSGYPPRGLFFIHVSSHVHFSGELYRHIPNSIPRLLRLIAHLSSLTALCFAFLLSSCKPDTLRILMCALLLSAPLLLSKFHSSREENIQTAEQFCLFVTVTSCICGWFSVDLSRCLLNE